MMGRSRKIYSVLWWVNVKERDLLEDLIIYRKILNPTYIFLGSVHWILPFPDVGIWRAFVNTLMKVIS
jgi:hypothetical protein